MSGTAGTEAQSNMSSPVHTPVHAGVGSGPRCAHTRVLPVSLCMEKGVSGSSGSGCVSVRSYMHVAAGAHDVPGAQPVATGHALRAAFAYPNDGAPIMSVKSITGVSVTMGTALLENDTLTVAQVMYA
jgi:hypothetical protein